MSKEGHEAFLAPRAWCAEVRFSQRLYSWTECSARVRNGVLGMLVVARLRADKGLRWDAGKLAVVRAVVGHGVRAKGAAKTTAREKVVAIVRERLDVFHVGAYI